MNTKKSYTERYARLLAAQHGIVWKTLPASGRLAWIGRALEQMARIYDERETRRGTSRQPINTLDQPATI